MVNTQLLDTELLDKYIEDSGLKIGYICGMLGITRQAFGKKRRGITPFKAAEVYVLCDICHITDDRDKIFLPKSVK
jgi:hypothetical protein